VKTIDINLQESLMSHQRPKIYYLPIAIGIAVLFLWAVTLATSAEAAGHRWFVEHIKPGSACSGAIPTTYYGEGRHNADGSRFNSREHSAASWDYPFGTVIRVTNSQNGESVEVVVKDRGPARWIYNLGIKLDISTGAARAIHLGQNGRFESGWTCQSVVSLGTVTERHRGRRGVQPMMASSDYMSRAGAGI